MYEAFSPQLRAALPAHKGHIIFNDRINEGFTVLIPPVNRIEKGQLEALGCRVRGCDFAPEPWRPEMPHYITGPMNAKRDEEAWNFVINIYRLRGKPVVGCSYVNIPIDLIKRKVLVGDDTLVAPDLPRSNTKLFPIIGEEIDYSTAIRELSHEMRIAFNGEYTKKHIRSEERIEVTALTIEQCRDMKKYTDYAEKVDTVEVTYWDLKDDLTSAASQFLYENPGDTYPKPKIANHYSFTIDKLKELLDDHGKL